MLPLQILTLFYPNAISFCLLKLCICIEKLSWKQEIEGEWEGEKKRVSLFLRILFTNHTELLKSNLKIIVE